MEQTGKSYCPQVQIFYLEEIFRGMLFMINILYLHECYILYEGCGHTISNFIPLGRYIIT